MYIAIVVLLCGILAGRLARPLVSRLPLRKLISGAIFLLLFLLGASIGKNSALLAQLPDFGWQALILMLFCVGGSILCCILIQPLFKNDSHKQK